MIRAAIVGSANMDLVVRVPKHPHVGETILGGDLERFAGGKGANQAVASARLGAQTTFVGAVGNDEAGSFLTTGLGNEGINTSHVRLCDRPTGVAVISVGPDGDNTIVVSPGANECLVVPFAPAVQEALAQAQVVLAQLEVPLDAVAEAAQLTTGIFILDPAPAPAGPLDRELLAKIDVLVPNETELSLLASVPLESLDTPSAIFQAACSLNLDLVVVTLGARGAMVVQNNDFCIVDAPSIQPVDTTGAGDAFRACLAVELASGASPIDAVRAAVRVGAAAALRSGAQPSMPTPKDVLALLGIGS